VSAGGLSGNHALMRFADVCGEDLCGGVIRGVWAVRAFAVHDITVSSLPPPRYTHGTRPDASMGLTH
jgi:hypothetical protein